MFAQYLDTFGTGRISDYTEMVKETLAWHGQEDSAWLVRVLVVPLSATYQRSFELAGLLAYRMEVVFVHGEPMLI
jgi:hypothetical protein